MEVSIIVVEWKLEQEAKEDLFEEVIVSSSHINHFLCHTNILWGQTGECWGTSRETWNSVPGWGSLAETREQTSWEKEEGSRGEGPGIAQSQVLQAVVRVIAHGNKKGINRMRNGVESDCSWEQKRKKQNEKWSQALHQKWAESPPSGTTQAWRGEEQSGLVENDFLPLPVMKSRSA